MWIPITIETSEGPIIVNLSRVKYCTRKRYCRECPGPEATTIVGDQFSVDAEEPISEFARRASMAADIGTDPEQPEPKPNVVNIRNPWRI